MGVAGQLNGPSKDERRSRSAHTLDRERLDHKPEIEFVPPSVVEEQLRQDAHLNQDVKPWLVSFGELKPGTNVSLHFRINESNMPQEKPLSLLPLLTNWIRAWFDKSSLKSAGELQDRNSLTWLFSYAADYIELGHFRLDEEEVRDLCVQLLDICLKARHQAHLEGCLTVLLSVARVEEFPRDCLRDLLSTLSQANVLLDKPLSHAGETVKLLATGSLQKDTIADLFSALLGVAEPHYPPQRQSLPDFDVTKHLNIARGAIRYLSTLLEVHGVDEKFVIDVQELFGILKGIAKTLLLRLATEIQDLLSHLTTSTRVDEVLNDQALTSTLLDIYDLCKEASIIPDSADRALTKTKSPGQEQVSRERRYKRDHELSLATFKGKLTGLLSLMDTVNASRLWSEVRKTIHYQTAHKRANAIGYIKREQVCMPGKTAEWKEELHLLLDNIIIADTTEANTFTEKHAWEQKQLVSSTLDTEISRRTEQRLEVLRLCARAIGEAASYNKFKPQDPADGETSAQVGVECLKKLLKVLNMETDVRVIQVLLEELTKLCSLRSSLNEEPYMTFIVDSLKVSIIQHTKDSLGAEVVYLMATEALRTIFLGALTHVTCAAYQIFHALLEIADCTKCKSARCRLVAMSVLIRLRCHASGRLYVHDAFDCADIAGAVCKTDESLSHMFLQVMDSSPEEEKATLSNKHRDIYQRQLWIYPDEAESVKKWLTPPQCKVFVTRSDNPRTIECDLPMSKWIECLTSNLQVDSNWETYSYIIVHLGDQLTNIRLFENSQDQLHLLRGYLCGRVRDSTKMFIPPRDIGLVVTDVALCFYQILTNMIPFYTIHAPFPQHESLDNDQRGIDLVRAFRDGLSPTYEGAAKLCIHALSVCCFEMPPKAMSKEYPGIVQIMAQNIFKPYLLVHILEFLAQVARLPHLHINFTEDESKQILYICIRALQAIRQKDEVKSRPATDTKRDTAHSRKTPYRAAILKERGLSQYSCALSYHTMIFWFLSIKLGSRHRYVSNVIDQLTWKDSSGKDIIDEQTVVMIDMMQRSAFSDLPETSRDDQFQGEDIEHAMYLVGNSIYEIEMNMFTGLSQVTKRQASGTTYAQYKPNVPSLPKHHDTSFFKSLEERGYHDKASPSHTLLNLIASAVPVKVQEQPLKLNLQEEYVSRAIRLIDKTPTVDSHKIGVILLRTGQTKESEYLANTTGTNSFDDFLDSMGTRVSLKGPCDFINWGLVYEQDGIETVAWRDRINEVVLEVSVLMPNTDDVYQSNKKRHIGNCSVLIVFNQSNEKWEWGRFASQVTTVQIVITPANSLDGSVIPDEYDHEFFRVEVFTKEDWQNVSVAAETKVVSKATLAPFVRLLALNANIFSACCQNESTSDSEFPSSWRFRLQAIQQLRERTLQRTPMGEDTAAQKFDFSRWT